MNAAKRLEAALAQLSRVALGEVDPAREEEILRQRAALAAAERVEEGKVEARLLAFRIGGATYGIPSESVRAVAIVRSMTPLPGVPRPVVGLLGVRGRLITVIDLTQMIDSDTSRTRPFVDTSKVLVIADHGRELGVLAEELLGIRDVRATELRDIEAAGKQALVRMLGPDGIQVVDLAVVFEDPVLRAAEAE